MKRRRSVLRVLCFLCAVVLLAGTATVECGSGQMIAVSVPQAASAGVRLQDAVSVASDAVETLPYVSDAAMDELHAIIAYALGENPTEGKSPDEAGQNTKNNVAISLLRLRRTLRFARTVRFVLEPYDGADNVFELCVYVRRLLRKEEECVHTGALYDRTNRTICMEDGTGMMGIGYDFNYEFNTFSAAGDPWQRNFGFCRMYDGISFLIGDFYETIRVPFRYGGKDWMIQIWKGVYSWNMLGGEVGLYNKPIDRDAAFYDCATDDERMPMSFCVSLGDETIIETETAVSWWQTAFTQHRLAKPRDLTMTFTLTFPSGAMLRAFRDSLRSACPDVTVKQNGLTLCCVWQGER